MIDDDVGMDASDDETQEENERVLAFFDQLVEHGTDMSSSEGTCYIMYIYSQTCTVRSNWPN